MKAKKVVKHLKKDIETFKHEAREDRKLIKELKHTAKKKHIAKKSAPKKKHIVKKAVSKGKKKIEKVMHEFKENKLHSGSKKGPKVSNPKQAIAIALSEARKAGAKIPKKKRK